MVIIIYGNSNHINYIKISIEKTIGTWILKIILSLTKLCYPNHNNKAKVHIITKYKRVGLKTTREYPI